MVFRVGLTGGIASGKSTVSTLFAELGVTVIDADIIARELSQPGTPNTSKSLSNLAVIMCLQMNS